MVPACWHHRSKLASTDGASWLAPSMQDAGRRCPASPVSLESKGARAGGDRSKMARKHIQLAAVLGLCGLLAGCNTPRLTYGQPAARLQAQPIAPVTSQTLAPPPGTMVPGETDAEAGATGGESFDVAALEAPEAAVSITPGELAGGWNLTSEGETCSLFTSQTTWSGGYRASTRGCNSPLLSTISAWNITGQQIQLFNGEGQLLATLFGSSKTEYNGQTRTGQAISFSR